MQLQAVAEPFPSAPLEAVELSRLLIKRIVEGEVLDFLTPADDDEPVTEPAHAEASVAGRRDFTDVELLTAVRDIAELTKLAAVWLRRDLAFAAANPKGDHRVLIDEIRRRADALRQVDALRPQALLREPRLAQWWDDTQHEITLHAIASSEQVITLIESGKMRQRSETEIALEFVHVLPTAFGTAEQAPEDVVEFCASEGIALALLTATKAAKESFPEAHDPQFEVTHDPEGYASWVTIRITVPRDQSLARYNRYVSEVVRLIPDEELNKISLAYIPE